MSLFVRRLNVSSVECEDKETGLRLKVQGMPRERDMTMGVHACVGTAEGVHVQWRQTGHQSDTQGACRAVNQWTTTGNWHNTTCS